MMGGEGVRVGGESDGYAIEGLDIVHGLEEQNSGVIYGMGK